MVVNRVAQEWQDQNRRAVKDRHGRTRAPHRQPRASKRPTTERLARQAIYNDWRRDDGGYAEMLAAKYQLLKPQRHAVIRTGYRQSSRISAASRGCASGSSAASRRSTAPRRRSTPRRA